MLLLKIQHTQTGLYDVSSLKGYSNLTLNSAAKMCQ